MNKIHDPSFFNDLPDLLTLNPNNLEQKMQKLKHFLMKTSKKAEELLNFEVSLEKEFSLLLSSFEITNQKLYS